MGLESSLHQEVKGEGGAQRKEQTGSASDKNGKGICTNASPKKYAIILQVRKKRSGEGGAANRVEVEARKGQGGVWTRKLRGLGCWDWGGRWRLPCQPINHIVMRASKRAERRRRLRHGRRQAQFDLAQFWPNCPLRPTHLD